MEWMVIYFGGLIVVGVNSLYLIVNGDKWIDG